MNKNEQWLKWAVELQAIAQGGLFYGKDKFDIERYERIREISAEMISYKTEISTEKVQNLFCSDVGYQTPKIDTRAAIFKDGKILLVHEANGTWSLPGGWCDVDVGFYSLFRESESLTWLKISCYAPEIDVSIRYFARVGR